MAENPKIYDLEERTANFGEEAIRFARSLPQDTITRPLISQFIRSATSIGANFCEADDAESGSDFKHKLSVCKKETRETKHWLRMIVMAIPDARDDSAKLWQEAKELNLIFNAIVHKIKNK